MPKLTLNAMSVEDRSRKDAISSLIPQRAEGKKPSGSLVYYTDDSQDKRRFG